MSNITGTITNGITLGQAGHTSPLKITGGGYVSNSTGAAVYASGSYADAVVVNHGTIIDSSGFDAVELKDGGSVGNTGLIQGYNGVDISGAAGAVTNAGTIAGTGAYGAGVVLSAGGSVSNSGLIEGRGVYYNFYGYPFLTGGAVDISGAAGTVTNSGTIVGTGIGVVLGAGGSVGNTGLIQGYSGVFVPGFPFYPGAASTVTNSGTIISTSASRYDLGDGVYLGTGGLVANTGFIEGGFFGVGINDTGTVVNAGTIVATFRGSNGFGIGVYASAVDNSGLIQGESGIFFGGRVGTVVNSGTIAGTGTAESQGIVGFGSGSVANSGLIQDEIGIAFFGSGAVVTNSGTIAATGASRDFVGVSLYFGGSVANTTGLIEGYNGVVIGGFGFGGGGTGTVTNSGRIVGTGTGSLGAGVVLRFGGTVVDFGTISGANGTAISFGGTGGNLLALEHGYDLGGTVTVAGTGNTLELLGAGGPVTVDFDKSGAGFTNFGTVAFGPASGFNETLTITNDAALPMAIAGFTQLHDIVDLTQLGPKGATATLNISDQLVVSNGSQSVALQLDPSENYSGVVWKTTPDGKGGTDVTVQHAGAAGFSFADISALPNAAGAIGPPAGMLSLSEGNGGASLFPLPGGGTTALVDPTVLRGIPFG